MEEKRDTIKELMLLQPNNVTFGQYSINGVQENILTTISDALQKHMTREQNVPLDLFGEPYVTINCDEAGGYNHKQRVIAEAKDLATKMFSFRWQVPGKNRTYKTYGVIITDIHDVEGTNTVVLNFNKWAIPFLVYYGGQIGGTRFDKNVALSLRGDKVKRIYKIICSQRDRTYYEYPIKQFIEDFQLGPSYKPSVIARSILEPAAKKIKESNSDVWFDFELTTKYRKPKGGGKQNLDTIVFHIKSTKATQGTDQFKRNETIRRWVEIALGFPTDSSALDATDKIIASEKCDMFFNKCVYYDNQISSGEKTTEHVKNILRKILRDEFGIKP